MVDGVLGWWVWVSGKEWCWGSTWGGRYPMKDVWPWLDPCSAGVGASAKTKPAVESKRQKLESQKQHSGFWWVHSIMNEMRWELNDVWPQWTCVKRRIGAANCSKKLIKNREVETLPTGSGGTGNVPTVSGRWATNGAWTLGWVSSRICTGDRRQQEVINW